MAELRVTVTFEVPDADAYEELLNVYEDADNYDAFIIDFVGDGEAESQSVSLVGFECE